MKAARMLRSCLRPFTCISRLPSLSRVAPASFAGLGLRSTGRHSSSRYTHPFACGSARYAVYVNGEGRECDRIPRVLTSFHHSYPLHILFHRSYFILHSHIISLYHWHFFYLNNMKNEMRWK